MIIKLLNINTLLSSSVGALKISCLTITVAMKQQPSIFQRGRTLSVPPKCPYLENFHCLTKCLENPHLNAFSFDLN